MRDLHNKIQPVVSINPAALTALTSGAVHDLAGYQSAEFIIGVGARTSGTATFTVYEGDTATPSTDASGSIQGTLPVIDGADDDDQVYKIGYKGDKRYVQIVCDASAGSVILGVWLVKSDALNQPVS